MDTESVRVMSQMAYQPKSNLLVCHNVLLIAAYYTRNPYIYIYIYLLTGSLSSSIVSKQCFGAFSRLKLYDRVLADDEIAKSYGVSTLKTPSIDWNKTEKINAFQWVVQKDKYIKQTNRDR